MDKEARPAAAESPSSYERRRPDLTFRTLRIEIAALYTFQVLLTADLSQGSAVPY